MAYAPGMALVAAYLLGSIPVGVMAGRFCAGVDPREAGSKNIGFTNVLRVAGKVPGALTLLGDIGKGSLAVIVSRTLVGQGEWELATGAAAILGHMYPVFLRFKGGKGVATALGVLLAVDVMIGGSLLMIWLGSAAIWRISSLAALIAFGALPGLMWVFHRQAAWLVFALGVSLLIGYRHAGNIRRLLAGTEPKFGMR
jgi:glycerol-3-phosphate acyltransferase PlsY